MYPPIQQEHRKELWRRSYPTTVGVLLSIFQMILTSAIVGCETVNMFIHFPRMNAFVGYWTCPFFMAAFISLAGASCFCRIRCCGTATLVFQCMSLVMALCVIVLDSYFLVNPLQCFFSTYCGYLTYYYNDLFNLNTLYGIKVPVIQGQLSAGVLMFVSCLIYIIIYTKTNSRVSEGITILNGALYPSGPIPTVTHYHHSQLVPFHQNTPYINPDNGVLIPPGNATPKNELICPSCRSTFQVSMTLKV